MAKPLRPEDENRTYRRFGNFAGYTDYSEDKQNDYPTVSQTFQADQKKRTLNGTRDVNVDYKAKDSSTRTSVATPAARKSGRPATAALSSRGVLGTALGGATKLGGRTTQIAGKQTGQQSNRVNQLGKTAVGLVRSAKATEATLWVISTGLGIFYLVQLFIGLAYLISFSALGLIDSFSTRSFADGEVGFRFTNQDGGVVARSFTYFYQGVNFLLENILGYSIEEDVAGLFIVSFALSLLWGFITLLCLSFMYVFQGIKPFWGEGAGLKNGLFLFTLVSYVLPILNLLPVFILWALAVWKYPK